MFEAQLYGHVARPNTSTYDEYFVDLRSTFSFPGGAVSFIGLGNDNRDSSSNEGNYLLRASPTLEPGASIMVGAGLVAIGQLPRRRAGQKVRH